MPTFVPTSIRWWYPAIADWMIANPDGSMADCAKALNRHVNTVRTIVSSDIFKEFYAQRRAEWQAQHDFAILDRVNRVAKCSLDLMLDNIEKKGDKIPMADVKEIALGALDRLGYAPKTQGGPQVNFNLGDDNRRITVAVTSEALLEAQQALRAAEAQRAVNSKSKVLELESAPVVGQDADVEAEAGQDDVHTSETES